MVTNKSSRREFLCSVAGCAAAAVAGGCTDFTHAASFRGRFRELSSSEIEDLIGEIEADCKKRFAKDVTVSATGPRPGVQFAYALDVSRCVGCRRCVTACVQENNQSRARDENDEVGEIHWIRVLEMDEDKGVDFAHANPYYDPAEVPREGHSYLPVACQQCRNPPCVKSCPVGATWQEDDGIVVVDQDWCIGCRCCIASCPYGARRFNWTEPNLPAEELNPNLHCLGNVPRKKGVVEKCTFCIQRVREDGGHYPACVEICPVGARKFGDLADPTSEVRYILEHKRVFVLKAELNTRPRFYYYA